MNWGYDIIHLGGGIMKIFRLLLNTLGLIFSGYVLNSRLNFVISFSMYLDEEGLLPTDVLDGGILADVASQNFETILVFIIMCLFAVNLVICLSDWFKDKKRSL